MHWHQIPPEKRTHAEALEAQQAYFKTLLAEPSGREVYCDMLRRVAERIEGCAFEPELAVAQLWLEAFLKDSLRLAGVTDDMQIVTAMTPIAESPNPKDERFVPEDHEE